MPGGMGGMPGGMPGGMGGMPGGMGGMPGGMGGMPGGMGGKLIFIKLNFKNAVLPFIILSLYYSSNN